MPVDLGRGAGYHALHMEVAMFTRKTLGAVFVVLLTAGAAVADIKIVKMTHRDGFTMMGQTQPPSDVEQTTWISANSMFMDQGDTATIVRIDTGKLIVINYTHKTYSILDLPIDLEKLLPPEMAQGFLAMMTFEVTITATDEHKTIGEWKVQRYNMTMASKMMTAESTMWATTNVDFDHEAFHRLYGEMISLQPGMAAAAEEMRQIKGIVVEQETLMTMMGDTTVKSSDTTTSIEELDPPAGIYEPPPDFTEKPFDFMASMQK
jgi:hypothetical protein